jgi:hypothetical protein
MAYQSIAPRWPHIGLGDNLIANRARNTWAQDQGLALYILIDELVPDWRSRTFGPGLTSPYGMLEEAVLSTAPG